MKVKDILNQESANPRCVFIYKKGMFYRVYNQSALWFVQHVKEIKLHSRYIKYLEQHIVWGGYPETLHSGIIKQLGKAGLMCIVDKNTTRIEEVMKPGPEQVSMRISLLEKKRIHDLPTPKHTPPESTRCCQCSIRNAILHFNTLHKTPLQAMQLIDELQKILNEK